MLVRWPWDTSPLRADRPPQRALSLNKAYGSQGAAVWRVAGAAAVGVAAGGAVLGVGQGLGGAPPEKACGCNWVCGRHAPGVEVLLLPWVLTLRALVVLEVLLWEVLRAVEGHWLGCLPRAGVLMPLDRLRVAAGRCGATQAHPYSYTNDATLRGMLGQRRWKLLLHRVVT